MGCPVPLRNLVSESYEVGLRAAVNCGKNRIAYVFGVCLILTLGLFLAYLITKKQDEEYKQDPTSTSPTVVVPLWMCAAPIVYAIYTYYTAIPEAEKLWNTEKLNLQASKMELKDYINFRVGDERAKQGAGFNFVNTSILAGSSLFGKWLRGE